MYICVLSSMCLILHSNFLSFSSSASILKVYHYIISNRAYSESPVRSFVKSEQC